MNDYAAYKVATDRINEMEQQISALLEKASIQDAQYNALKEFITNIVQVIRVGAEKSEDVRFLMEAVNALGGIYNRQLEEIQKAKLTASS